MRLLVTGANGFVGSNVIKALYAKQIYEVIGTSLSDEYIGKEPIRYIQADFSKDNFCEIIMEEIKACDVVVHIGACINYDLFSKEVIMANCFGIQQVIKLTHLLQAKKLIFISTVPVVGKPVDIPVTEQHKISPQTAYVASKVFAEHLLLMNHGLGFKPIIFRITSPIGPNMPKTRMLSVFIDNYLSGKEICIYGKGIRRQNYVDVRDIAYAIHLASGQDVEGIFNIAGEHSYTSLQLASICSEVTNRVSKIAYKEVALPDEYYNWEVSIEKAKALLKYTPQCSITESIENIICSLEANR